MQATRKTNSIVWKYEMNVTRWKKYKISYFGLKNPAERPDVQNYSVRISLKLLLHKRLKNTDRITKINMFRIQEINQSLTTI